MNYIILVLAGALAGMVNSIAGGGVFLVLPSLIMAGLTGKQANATGSLIVWMGQVTALYENRATLPKKSKIARQIAIIGLFASIAGALLLVITPNVNFEHALPYLNAAATLIFIAGPWLKKQRRAKKVPAFVFPLFCVAVGLYGGYFGGGLGMLMLAALSMTNLRDVKQQNAVKLLAASIINFTSIVILFFAQLIVFRYAIPAGLGALAGGYIGSRYSHDISNKHLRYLVILIGLVTTVYLFVRFY